MKIDKGEICDDFLTLNRRQYVIPVYQRNYEWSKEQCTKLFRDIVAAGKSGRKHFCGSVVYSMLQNTNDINFYVLIDGQQRLTTVYILLKALLDAAETDKEREAIREDLFNKSRSVNFPIDTASKLKLKPIKSDNNQLLLLMDNKLAKVDKTSGIWHNYALFSQLIHDELEKGAYAEDILRGIESLTCASILLDSDENAQEIFERINSTGIPLSLADKIRNFVLMTDANQEQLYENYWLSTEEAVRRDNMTSFFINYLNIKVDGFPREDEAYDVFKEVYANGKYTNQQMLEEILHYARFYKAFLFGDPKYSETVNALLSDLQKLKQTTVFLFLFHVFDDYEVGVIKQDELEKVLRFLLTYSIRRLICEIGSNSLRGLYKTLYARTFARSENKLHYYDAIASFLMQLTSKDTLPTDEVFVAALEQKNLYRKNALCKYLLTAIENQGKEQLLTDNLTVEHILPQNRNLSTTWQNMLGENWESDRDKYLHTLGNLTLTAYNSELGDKPFAEKKELMSAAHSKVVTLYEDVKDCERWDASAIEARAKRLSFLILGLFPIEKPEISISFADPRYSEYTCDEPDDATYKTPNYYVLLGERVNSTNFADMLRSIVNRLYEIDSSIIMDMARNNERLLSWSQNIMFSFDKNNVYGDYKVKDTDIYENIGFSAAHTMQIIAALLDKYDIDHADFIYSARVNKTTPDKEET
jgi:uncharacterized protein with ParB-like and HNH nuclease domain